MLNCCCTKYRRNSHADLNDNEISSSTSRGWTCFKRKRRLKRNHKLNDNDLGDDNKYHEESNRLCDGPSITDSEIVDSLGNLPKFSSKFIQPTDCSKPNNNNNNNNLCTTTTNVSIPSSNTTVATSRRGSLYIFRHSEDLIVTPFAQILASLRNVRANFIFITNVHSSKEARFGSINTSNHTSKNEDSKLEIDDNQKSLTMETLDELEWCLEQLESIQTHRSVSDMASSKFKKILNKELSQYADQTKSGNQISDYICTTFLDSEMNSGGENSNDDDNTAPNRKKLAPSGSSNSGLNVDSMDSGVHGTEAKLTNKSHRMQRPSIHKMPSSSSSVSASHDQHQQEGKQRGNVTAAATINKLSVSFQDKQQEQQEQDQLEKEEEERNQQQLVEEEEDDDDVKLGYYGIGSVNHDELDQLLEEHLDTWGLDIFQVATLSDNRPLAVISFALFRKYDLFDKFSIEPRTFYNLITEVESQYRTSVPYHNSTHAADVTQSTNVLLGAAPLENVFSDLELMSVIFACIVHDVDHPGVTNQYLINTNDPLALLYNDASVLENHHLSVAFTALSRSENDISKNLSKKQRQSFRKMVIDMVLATDMSKHMSLLADLKTMVETKKVAGSGILNLDNYTDRIQILQNMVHCADLSNPTKPLSLYRNWTGRIMDEFFSQGDLERARHLDISPMCDRQTATIEKSQVSFIDFIVHPLWETWSDLVYPEAQNILDTLEDNREWYYTKIASPSTSMDPSK